MKDEKEMVWIIRILKHKQSFKKEGGTMADYERELGYTNKHSEFRPFLRNLIEKGALQFVKERKGGGNKFIVNTTKLMKIYKKNKYGKISYKECVDDWWSLRPS